MMRRVLAGTVVVLLLGGLLMVIRDRSSHYTVSASFPRAVGLYVGDDVRVVGVPIGRIEQIESAGDHVVVTMELDDATPIAADTGAVIVPPGVLSARYVQLTEPWLSSAKLADGATISASRTSAPLEIDDVTRELGRFLDALGPQGAGQGGGVADLVATSDEALAGNGTTLRASLADLADALDTVGESSGDIVTTIRQLERFVTTLARSDAAIRQFETGLSSVSGQLASQRGQLRRTIRNIQGAVRDVNAFVTTNGDVITTNVADLARITTTLKDRERELMEIADLAPIGVEGIFGAANLSTGVLEARIDLTALLASPVTQVCQVLAGLRAPQLCPSAVLPETTGGQ